MAASEPRRLEESIRAGESPGDLILLLRGGTDTREKLARHADRMVGRYTYRGEPARGISLFAARGDLDARVVLEARMSTYRAYYRVDAERLSALGTLLPTFEAPHWTLLFPAAGDDSGLLDELLAILGPVLDNPRYVPPEARRR